MFIVVFKSTKLVYYITILWTTDKLDSWEEINTTRQQHGKASELHRPVQAAVCCSIIPVIEALADALVVDVVEEAMFRYEEGITLELAFYIKKIESYAEQDLLKNHIQGLISNNSKMKLDIMMKYIFYFAILKFDAVLFTNSNN